MKNLAWVAGGLAVLVLLVGVLGRFMGDPLIILFGQTFAARSFLALGNFLLLLGILLALLDT